MTPMPFSMAVGQEGRFRRTIKQRIVYLHDAARTVHIEALETSRLLVEIP